MRVHSGDTVLGERVKTTLETSYRAYKNGPLRAILKASFHCVDYCVSFTLTSFNPVHSGTF